MLKSFSADKSVPDAVVTHRAFADAPVYVIDDESEMRRSLHLLLSTAGMVSWPFPSASDFLANLESSPILLDIRMPEMDGIQLMNKLLERGIRWPIIVMTAHGEIPIAVQAVKLGAIEFLEKPFAFEALESSLQSAFGQLSSISGANSIRSNARRRFALLTPRETDVVKILMQGAPNKVAAHQLSLSVRTIEMHRGNALAKLNVKSLAEVVRLASEADRQFHALEKDGGDAHH